MFVSCVNNFECQFLMINVNLNVLVINHNLFAFDFEIFKVTEVNFNYCKISTYCLDDFVIYFDNI